MSNQEDDTNNNVNIQKIILLKFLVRLNFYISSKLTFQNNADSNKDNIFNNKNQIKAIMDMYHQEAYTNSFIKNIDTSIIYIILQSLCNEGQSNDKICLEWQKYWKHLIVPRNPELPENEKSSVDYLTKILATNINTVAEFVDTSQKADDFSYKIKEIIRRSGITDEAVEKKIIDNLESTIAAIKSVHDSKEKVKADSEEERTKGQRTTYDKEQNEQPIKVLIERIQEVFNDTENLLDKNKTDNVNAFKENLKTNFMNHDPGRKPNKNEFSILYRKDFITDFETTLKEAKKKQTEYDKLLNEFTKEEFNRKFNTELNSEPFKGEISVLKEKKNNLDKRIKELEDLIKESNDFINSLVNPNKKDEELQIEARNIVNSNEPLVISSENPNKNALLASISSHHFNQSSFPFFPFLLNNYSPISSQTPPISNNKNALLATIASQYMNKNSISIFPFFFLTPSKTPSKTKDNKNALIAYIVSHETNNKNLNMFGFFQQLAEEIAAKKAKAKAREAEAKAKKEREERAKKEREQKEAREAEMDVLNDIGILNDEIFSLNDMRPRPDLRAEPPDITAKLSTLTSNIENLNNKLTGYKMENIEFSQYIKDRYTNLITNINSLLISHNINRIQYVISPGSSPPRLVSNIKSHLQTGNSGFSNIVPIHLRQPHQTNNVDIMATEIKNELFETLNKVNTFNFEFQEDSSSTPEEIIRQTDLKPRSPPSRPASPSRLASSSRPRGR